MKYGAWDIFIDQRQSIGGQNPVINLHLNIIDNVLAPLGTFALLNVFENPSEHVLSIMIT